MLGKQRVKEASHHEQCPHCVVDEDNRRSDEHAEAHEAIGLCSVSVGVA